MSNIPKEQADIYQNFFNFLIREHNIICTISEMQEIIFEASKISKDEN